MFLSDWLSDKLHKNPYEFTSNQKVVYIAKIPIYTNTLHIKNNNNNVSYWSH